MWCTVIAGWAESTSYTRYRGEYTVPVFQSKDISWNGEPARISRDWARFLTPTFTNTKTSVFHSLMSVDDPQQSQQYLGSTIGSLLASGMMNVGYDSSADWPTLLLHKYPASEFYRDPGSAGFPLDRSLFDIPKSLAEGKVATTFQISVHDPLYSAQGIPVKLSLAVMILYIIYISGFIIHTLAFSRISSSAWDSNAEWTALALLSKPTDKLKNTSAGIETMELFKEPVNIRAAGWDHVELVFANDKDERAMDAVRPNKEY